MRVIKGAFLIAVAVFALNEALALIEKHAECTELRRRALYSLQPGKPCSDFETRVQLEGEFLNCNEAERVAASNTIPCAVTKWLDGWLPSRIMGVVSENFLMSSTFAVVIVVATIYIFVTGVISDRAHARTSEMMMATMGHWQPFQGEFRHNDNRRILAPPPTNRISYVDESMDNRSYADESRGSASLYY